jgi:hypothetical protein
MQPTEPQWFYSSLAQVSAGLVGFLGAFLLVRLSAYIAEWRTARTALLRLQREWSAAQRELKDCPPANAAAARMREADAWDDLRQADDERRGAHFPAELVGTLGILGLLLIVGALVPLLALPGPSTGEQVAYLVPVAALVVVAGAVMIAAAWRTYVAWRDTALWPPVAARIDEERAREEVWAGQD